METRFIINNMSQELFLNALKTLAMPPQHAEIELAYKCISRYSGIYECTSNLEYARSRYFAICKKKSIIPARAKFQYDHDKDLFFPGRIDFSFNMLQTEKDAITATECLAEGGKINNLSFEISHPHAQKGIETLLKTHVKKLLKQNYHFCSIEAAFSYADEDDSMADTSLFYAGNSLDLRIGFNIDRKDAAKLTKWFQKLQKKYEK